LRGLGSGALNVVVPILLAWILTRGLHRYLHPSDVRDVAPRGNSFGPLRIRLKLPGTSRGIPEPVLVCGRPGNASLVYIRLLPGSRAKVGVEFWGLRADQSGEFPVPSPDAEIEVTCYLPALFPEVGDPDWGNLSPEIQRARRGEYYITVDGVVRLNARVDYKQPPHSALYLGENPVGGSLVSDRFTGAVLGSSQRF
jgi:hypothetical protein